ncbi:7TM diverse intracellular signaling domain-containing protein [Winogradskyella wichelsiae]|uniref:hybrid sensor histidine kinase/response regulator n=1 Tax=Winogradskyella wichelsiae TaxID=2697007 RepID=UPI003EF51AC4
MKPTILIIYLLACTLYAQKPAFNPESSSGELFEYSEYTNTERAKFAIEDVLQNTDLKFQTLQSENHDLGFTTNNYWVRFRLENTLNTDKTYYLVTARPITDVVDLYTIKSEIEISKNGDQVSFDKKDINHRENVFKIKLKAQSKQLFYINLSSDGETLNLLLNLYDEDSFINKNYTQQLFLGLFYGVLLLTSLIYLFFYTSLSNKTFLYYCLYAFSIALMQMSLDGFIHQYILPNGGYLNSRVVLITALFSNLFLLKYCEYFLKVNLNLKHFKIAYNIIYGVICTLFLMLFINSKTLELAYPLSNLNGLLSLILIVTTVFKMRFKRIYVDPFFSLGILFLVIGLTGFVMNNLGLLPTNFYTQNSSKFGTGIEVILLSLSMTKLIKKLRLDNEHSQELALKNSEEISEIKSYFMSNISHELRTPINAIMGMVDIELASADNDVESRKKYQIIKNASISLLSNVNDVLDFEKIEKKELKLREEEFNPSIVLNQISNNWKTEANKKGLKYAFEMDSEIPTKVIGDSDRFVQIINNVLANAVKFTKNGQIILKLKCLPQPNDISSFCFQISDSGVGMSKISKDNVFVSFNQMQLNHKRQFGGMGLGLTIAKHLIELYKGSIKIESKIDKGTDVFIKIPLKKLKNESATVDNKSAVIFEKPLHILVVEDNKLNQLVMRKLLGSFTSVSFSVVENGSEALKALRNDVYDLILMDLQMPVMDGYEATKFIRSGELGSSIINIPIIAVTADAMEETRQRVLEIGMNDYMTKPVKRDLLYEKIKCCFNNNLSVA